VKQWIKLSTDIIDDPKMGSLEWAEWGMWVAFLALAGKLDHRDRKENETGQLDTVDNIAWHLRTAGMALEGVIQKFIGLGMMHEDKDGVLFISNYAKRQMKPPSDRRVRVKDRVKRHRATKETGSNESVTPLQADSNESVTPLDKNRIDKNRIDKKRKDTRADKTSADVVDPAGSPVSDDNSLSKSECDTIRKALEASFVEVSGLSPPTLTTAAQKRTAGQLWFAPLRAIAEETDWDAATGQQLIQATVDKMVADGLTISSPKSILNTSRSVMADARRGKSVTAGLSKNESSTLGALTRVAERLEHGES
jgi:hypothetical protein